MRTRNALVTGVARRSVAVSLCSAAVLVAAAQDAEAGLCAVPGMRYRTIQSAANDAACSEIVLGERIYTEQISLNRPGGITLRGAGAGRTIIVSPTVRSRSTVSTSFLPNYTYVVQVRPGTSATIS